MTPPTSAPEAPPTRSAPAAPPGPDSLSASGERRPAVLRDGGAPAVRRDRRWQAPALGRTTLGRPTPPRPALAVALVLASLSLMALDQRAGVLDPVRDGVGAVVGPLETATARVSAPLTAVPDWFATQSDLRDRVADLERRNDELTSQLATADVDRNRLAEYDALATASARLNYDLVPARVVAVGPAQSFSDTVTIDAGSDAGVRPDQTVLNGEGLVGRVLRVTRTTATVLLIVDPGSTVGGRVGSSMEIGFLTGRGGLGGSDRLDLELVDETSVPARGESVVTWGSAGGGPYVGGVPVGRVTAVFSSLRETSQRAVIEPYADLTSLDLVGVVVPAGTVSDRNLVTPEHGLGTSGEAGR